MLEPDLLIAIAMWCETDPKPSECKDKIVECVVKDKRPADRGEYFEKQLLKCMEKK